ncbi:hypothetical protein [Streptomyces sp. NPDC046909]|uniref:hypothetical protein n=1 Tax=Streptomyces sp. NPDC046909 TaxID=3155617 RepID=UPI0033F64429
MDTGSRQLVVQVEHPGVQGASGGVDIAEDGDGVDRSAAVVNSSVPMPASRIAEDLLDGGNTVVVRVSSSLNNRLIARGYYDDIPDVGVRLFGRDGHTHITRVRNHGLVGPVRRLTQ